MARITLRRLVLATLILVPVGAAAVATAVASGWLNFIQGILLLIFGMIILAVGATGVGLQRLNSRMQYLLREQRKRAELVNKGLQAQEHQVRDCINEVTALLKDLRGALGEDRLELLARLAQSDETLERIGEHVTELEKSARELHVRMMEQVSDVTDNVAKTQAKLHNRLYAKVQAQAGLLDLISPRAPMPLFGGWAIDADTMHEVISILWERRPELVVECGSGSSSVWLGYMIERLGTGRVISLEHDERFLETSRELIRAHSLQKVVEIRYAPLEDWTHEASMEQYRWYAQATLEDLHGIDLLLVDGPPGAVGPDARYPALPLLLPLCANHAVIVLDDVDRPDEKALSDRWLAEWPELERRVRGQGSAHVFYRSQQIENERITP